MGQIGRVGEPDESADAERQDDQHDRRQLALGGQCLDLAVDLTALADGVADRVEHLGQVAAGLLG